ncbi:xaa-Pro aminopeptidase 1 isoform X2 [Lingula anatina]|uniref:Xaa-Pro aminopeptidase 1 isoform X2 n=1 Tax=Lingula anatina TaxID=7574 RepID=A0A1S3KAK9_LINAN|nr:xaa-Pro aminopeptidase 1 isoform X2 [Lingula anatina]|eukprot:XP_013419296.1 xaa-Pro aminopeptidase 1 isoform X2 [Lingula anatina]
MPFFRRLWCRRLSLIEYSLSFRFCSMSAKNTSLILHKLRGLMKNSHYVTEELQAYIVPSEDAHQSEYIAPCDCRREFVSGFSGSAGSAVIVQNKAAMWTDGRYFLQAERQMDDNWTLMKHGLPETPTQGDWLSKVLPPSGKVGVDPFLLSAERWKELSKTLESNGHMLVPVAQNLVDIAWNDRPPPPNNPLIVQPLKYTGSTWQDKVRQVRAKMKEKKVGMLVVTALDEIAWLFNLRGSDIAYNPVFFSYAIVKEDMVGLWIDETKLDAAVLHHLNAAQQNGDGSDITVTLYPYDSIKDYISALMEGITGKVWISNKSSYALVSLVPQNNHYGELSPIAEMKSKKNSTEIDCMKRAHVKDAVTLCEYFAWLEKEVPKGNVSEMSAAEKLELIKRQQEDYVSLSFSTISSSGPNGAVIHYSPSKETSRELSVDEMYLCDSGAQYRDGTTDVTRTMHFGKPTAFQQECFTRVLQGHIALALVIFPNKTKGHMLDTLARTALWEVGQDYLHGTGHGVGAFLNVHEGPCGISYKSFTDCPLQEGMILSNEPGYYEDGQFGIRIENLFLVKQAETKHNFKNKGFLTFEPLTLVPIQTKMLVPSMLSQKEIDWLNAYHLLCREVVGQELKDQDKQEAYEWMMRETEPLG